MRNIINTVLPSFQKMRSFLEHKLGLWLLYMQSLLSYSSSLNVPHSPCKVTMPISPSTPAAAALHRHRSRFVYRTCRRRSRKERPRRKSRRADRGTDADSQKIPRLAPSIKDINIEGKLVGLSKCTHFRGGCVHFILMGLGWMCRIPPSCWYTQTKRRRN